MYNPNSDRTMIENLFKNVSLETPVPTQRPHLIDSHQLTREWLEQDLFPSCNALREGAIDQNKLAGKALFSLFYEPSFLTRNSFERAMSLMGGKIHFTEDASQFFPSQAASHIEDTIQFLACLHFDVIVIRTNQPGAVSAAAEADVVSVINGGSDVDHPTQAILDVYTLQRELGKVDGIKLAVAGRVNHRNVNALLITLAQFNDVQVRLMPYTGRPNADVMNYCQNAGMDISVESSLAPYAKDLDAIYVNGADTAAHTQLMLDRGLAKEKIDAEMLQELRPDCVILDPMQRTESLITSTKDPRWAGFRQAENGLYVRMALLLQMLDS